MHSYSQTAKPLKFRYKLFVILAVSVVTLIIIALVAGGITWATLGLQPVRNVGIGMKPALRDGDRILVRRKFGEINRGDIILFFYPPDTSKNYIKRVVGLPGEVIEMNEGKVLVNGTVLAEPYLDPQYLSHDTTVQVKIPEQHYFVLGDNRKNSSDSRYWGTVPRALIWGKVMGVICLQAQMRNDCEPNQAWRSPKPMMMGWLMFRHKGRAWLIISLLLCATLASGCLKATKPNLPRVFPSHEAQRRTGKRPVIVIPGVLGSRLVNRRTNEQAWPSLFVAHDDTLALPISSTNLAENTDDIVATEIIETARLARLIPEISVYDSLLIALERYGGYRRGSFDAPTEDGDRDTFYVFAYDWRRDNVESARALAQKIAALKQRLHRPDLRFDLVAHSMGGLVARYYAMYGDRDVLTADTPRPDWSGARHLGRIVQLGTPNAGSMDALRTLLLGYSVTETNLPRLALLRQFDRDVTFTVPSLYQLLPHQGYARFLDAELQPMAVDLFDVETWRRFGWTIAFEADFRGRERRALLKRQGGDDGVKTTARLADERERFLRAVLARAAAFHRALDVASTPPESLRLYLFGGDCEPTLDAVMVATIKGQLQTLFRSGQAPGNRQARNRAYEAMFAPGDGRVTRRSLFGLQLEAAMNESATRAMKLPPFYASFNCELHGGLPLNPTLQDNLLTVLLGNSY